ncbi:ABC transporter ATP-binding protein [Angustibacter sp. Root456]|uniref:ABC transporter ATP-binding protein n=1 Tax=Angustibacter sp. Root456 TaxID=1736539 RepID=UPI0006F5FDA9|nr:ABC transporter ATP-binding protein [Angustibacter sp. Root456]KQX62903.1 ABC transporter [Angustibacter sp. Root456]
MSSDYVSLNLAAHRQRRSLGRLRHLLARSVALAWVADRRLFVLNAALQLIAGLVAAAQVLITKAVLDAIIATQSERASVTAATLPVLALAAVMAFTTVSAAVQQQLGRLFGELVSKRTWEDILDVTGRVSLRAYETPGFYDQVQRVQTNAVTRPLMLTQGLIALAGGLFGSVGLSAAIIALHPLLLPLLLLSGIPMLLATRRASRLEFQFTMAQVPVQRMRTYLAMAQTGRDEAKEVRAFGLVQALRRRYSDVYDRYVSALRVHVGRRSRLALASSLASSALLALTLLAMIWLVSDGRIGLAQAGAAIVAVRLLAAQLNLLFASAQQIFESGLFLDDLDAFFRLGEQAETVEGGAPAPAGFERLDVDDVTFAYPGTSEAALRGVSLTLRRGQVIALVGENGSGKSTLAKVLAALYDVDSGAVRWDGTDVRTYERAGLRRAVSVIFQDFVRWKLSATENIAFGDPTLPSSQPAVQNAAERAGAHGLLSRLPAGYETVLSTMFAGGTDLSLGQWQRVALARAFYRDAPFVILDEPTASLDPRAEADLFRSLREMLAGRTVLYISHRMSTVRDADLIYVMHEGRIVEHGSHDELMASGGTYSELFRLQADAYVRPAGD